MVSPATTRRAAVFLLLLPLVHLAWLIGADLRRYLEPSPRTWDGALQSIVDADMRTKLPAQPVLIIGGQRVRLWHDLPRRFAPGVTLRRALGDATLEDLTFHYDRLVAYYRPAVLVIFPGYADLHLRDDKTPREFLRAVKALLDRDRDYARSRRRILLTPLLTPLHPGDASRIGAMSALAQRLAAERDDLLVIDANPALRRADGSPDPAYFRIDGVNLNAAGYAIITDLLRASLDRPGEGSAGPDPAGDDRRT
jgi:lysophospholipase L1-like esterase